MKPSKNHGKHTSKKVEILGVTPSGVWILCNDCEYFLSYKNYPWFMKASLKDVFNVQLLHGHHLFWPKLDIDLELESLQDPQKYPLKAAA